MKEPHLEILVEEPSMEAFLRALLPRLLGGKTSFEVYPYQCKDDLLNKLPARLHGYANWLPETWRIVVVVDRDDDNCKALKQKMEAMAVDAGLRTRTGAAQTWQVVNRIAIEELEAWYFGDWDAVRQVYPRLSATIPDKEGFRDPDALAGGTWETFERLLQRAGYFENGLRKTEAARSVGRQIIPERNRSRSFQAFREAILDAE